LIFDRIGLKNPNGLFEEQHYRHYQRNRDNNIPVASPFGAKPEYPGLIMP
jgi:hypothetical protein